MNTKLQKIWIIGCGDIGRRVADLYPSQAYKLKSIALSERSCCLNRQQGIETIKIDLSSTYSLAIDDFEHASLFYFVPPPKTGIHDSILESFLDKIGNRPQHIVLISTTGVYGDSKGEWINEDSAVNPVADRAKRRLSAEQLLKQWSTNHNKSYVILRVPGIYAKDRLPLERLKKGLPVLQHSEAGWSNRIHADDLAQACQLAMQSLQTNFDDKSYLNQTYNVTDGNPSSMTDYFNTVADYANLPHPPQVSMQQAELMMSPSMLTYLKESRRISNNKMLNHLNINLKYPTLKSSFN